MIEKSWQDAYNVAVKAEKTATGKESVSKNEQKNTDTQESDDGARYSIKNTSNMTLAQQLKAVYDGKLKSSDALYFGMTPDVLNEVGLDSLPLAFTLGDFRKSTKEKHTIPRRVLKQLQDNLSNPILSFWNDGEIGVLIDDIDGNGKPVLVAIHTNVEMDRKPVNAIKSVYGLDNPAQWWGNQQNQGKTLTVFDEEKAGRFLQTHDLNGLGGRITSFSKENIAQDNNDVNTRFSQKTSTSTKEQADLIRQNDRLKKAISYYKGQTKRTPANAVNEAAIKKIAKGYIRENNLRDLDSGELEFALTALYKSMADKSGTMESYIESATPIAEFIAENAVEKDDFLYTTNGDLRQYLRETKVQVPKGVKGDIADYGAWAKSHKG